MPTPHGFPAVIEVVVEIPAGSRNKYEYDEVAGFYDGMCAVTQTDPVTTYG